MQFDVLVIVVEAESEKDDNGDDGDQSEGDRGQKDVGGHPVPDGFVGAEGKGPAYKNKTGFECK